MKKLTKLLLAAFLYYSGILSIWIAFRERNNKFNPTILMYHRVLNNNDNEANFTQSSLIVSPRIFRDQMSFLRDYFNIISLPKLIDTIKHNHVLPKKAITITFDDGWRDNFTNALPVVRSLDIPITIFLTVDYIGTDRKLWFIKIAEMIAVNKISKANIMNAIESITGKEFNNQNEENTIEILKDYDLETIDKIILILDQRITSECNNPLDSRQMLTWNEVAQMKQIGVDFGSHGLSHSIMTLLGTEQVRQELRESKKILEEKLGSQVLAFAYPNGNFNAEIESLVQEAGYKCALTTNVAPGEKGVELFRLGRIGIHNGMAVGPFGNFSKSLFMFHISGFSGWLKKIGRIG